MSQLKEITSFYIKITLLISCNFYESNKTVSIIPISTTLNMGFQRRLLIGSGLIQSTDGVFDPKSWTVLRIFPDGHVGHPSFSMNRTCLYISSLRHIWVNIKRLRRLDTLTLITSHLIKKWIYCWSTSVYISYGHWKWGRIWSSTIVNKQNVRSVNSGLKSQF